MHSVGYNKYMLSYCTDIQWNVLLLKFRCNIFIVVRIIKEMPGSVASGTHCSIDDKSAGGFWQCSPVRVRFAGCEVCSKSPPPVPQGKQVQLPTPTSSDN